MKAKKIVWGKKDSFIYSSDYEGKEYTIPSNIYGTDKTVLVYIEVYPKDYINRYELVICVYDKFISWDSDNLIKLKKLAQKLINGIFKELKED